MRQLKLFYFLIVACVTTASMSQAQTDASKGTSQESTSLKNPSIKYDTENLEKKSLWSKKTNEKASTLLATIEVSQFSINGHAFLGVGPSLGLRYALSKKWAGALSISQSFDSGDSFSYLYTGLNLALSYALLGAFKQSRSEYTFNGSTLYEQKSSSTQVLALGSSLEQNLISGTSALYPVPGWGLNMSYIFNIWGRTFFTEAKVVLMSYQETGIVGFFAKFGVPF